MTTGELVLIVLEALVKGAEDHKAGKTQALEALAAAALEGPAELVAGEKADDTAARAEFDAKFPRGGDS